MSINISQETNEVFDQIVSARRTVRKFRNDIPPKEVIEQVIRAGILAPYAGLALSTIENNRRFIVFEKDSDNMVKAREIITSQLKVSAKKFNILTKVIPYLRKNGKAFAKALNNMSQNGIPAFETAPYYIVVAERKGFPPAEKQSLAHVMQNMWLKSTALGLGFQLLSATQTLSKNRDFIDLLGITLGEFEIDGCVIGYPDQTPPKRKEIVVNEFTTWL